MLHGWGLHGGVFDRVASQLADHYCVHLVDLPGHGASAPLARFDADEVADLVDAQFPFPVQVVGWSLGGLIAQHWAARHPDKVKSLALVATARASCATTPGRMPSNVPPSKRWVPAWMAHSSKRWSAFWPCR
ncbi:alpha/beta fold hydrolase [Aquitalea pelogenes]|uniref:alpha/beta fold hydrolase n=1 Tax=Aquitalea pelogenes TaxID=1293573 RepID=UPI001EFB7111|nr:alpha/beta fold hydrolase [Aquitalea pelogenes]